VLREATIGTAPFSCSSGKLGLRFSAEGSAASPMSCVCMSGGSAAPAVDVLLTAAVHARLQEAGGLSLANEGTELVHAFLAWVDSGFPRKEGGAQ
jgi:hypothetical protein